MQRQTVRIALIAVLVGGLALAGVILPLGWLHPGPPDALELHRPSAPPPRPAPPPGAPHVVLVIGCTVRQDQTSIYGGPPHTTPFLSELAAQGVVFDDPISAAPWTRPASAALLTGWHAVQIGMTEPGPTHSRRRLPPDVLSLAEVLQHAGYATAGISLNPNLHSTYGFDQGFDRYLQLAELWEERRVKVPASDALAQLDRLLEGLDPKRPLYLQAMLIDAHAPIRPEPHELLAPVADRVPAAVSNYRVGLRRFDAAVQAMATELSDRGFDPRRTLFIVVNDHGEGLSWPAAHGRAHGRYLAPSTVGGVWVMRGPGVAAGHRISGVASHVDVFPTVLGVLGMASETYQGPGIDHADAVAGNARSTTRKHAFADTWFRDMDRAAVFAKREACQWEFVASRANDRARRPAFRQGCFDRVNDPRHERFGPAEGPLLNILQEWRREATAAGQAFAKEADAEVGEGLEAQLEALGYVDPAEDR